MSRERSSGALRMQFDDLAQQREADAAGMWIFLATEVLLFGGLFFAYAVYRVHHPEVFVEASGHLHRWLGSANTGVLLTSSLTIALAGHGAERERRGLAAGMLAATLGLGLAFLALKGYEWHSELEQGLAPFLGWSFEYPGAEPQTARLFFGLYFAMTGLHFVHLAIGVGAVAVLLGLMRRPAPPARAAIRLETTALYWHYVDIVWVFLFPLLYLIR